MCVYCVANVLTVSTYTVLNALEILVSAFQNFLQIENPLNIKKVIGRNVWMCFVLTVSTQIALNALEILVLYRPYQHI